MNRRYCLYLSGIFLSLILAGTVWYSPAAAQTWVELTNPYTGGVNAFAFNSSGDMFAATAGGVYYSPDNGDNWIQRNGGLTHTDVYTIIMNAYDDLLAGTDGGVYYSVDDGITWAHTGLTDSVISLALAASSNVFAGTVNDGIFIGTSYGGGWTNINGATLTKEVIAIAVNSSDIAFALTANDGIFRSIDYGEHWIDVTAGISGDLHCITINEDDDIFVGTYNFDFGVYRSTNNGDDWELVNNGLNPGGAGVGKIIALAANSRGDLLASGGPIGVYEIYRSDDNGDSWTYFGLDEQIWELGINESDDMFAAGFMYVYRLGATALDVENDDQSAELPQGFALSPNYPNPFNPTTTIEFALPVRSDIGLTVYNVLGQRVRTLLERELPASEHRIEWDGTDDNGNRVASGVYFYRLLTDSRTLTRNMLLLK